MDWKLGGLIFIGALLAGPSNGAPYQCDDLEDAATELESAAEDLMACARQRDFTDECSRQARDARDAADSYENAVSEADSAFDGEANEVCPSPLPLKFP